MCRVHSVHGIFVSHSYSKWLLCILILISSYYIISRYLTSTIIFEDIFNLIWQRSLLPRFGTSARHKVSLLRTCSMLPPKQASSSTGTMSHRIPSGD